MTVLARLDAQTRARATVATRTQAAVAASWAASGTDRADIDAFVKRVVPIVRAGQQTTGSLTGAYVAAVVAEISGQRPTPVRTFKADKLRGVPLEEVYARPFVTVWTDLGKGIPYSAAVSAGADRLLRLVEDDLSLAHRGAARQQLDREPRVSSYRRVIRPEMSSGGSCPLCITAAENVYKSENLMPIHTRCSCEVMPIVGDSDVGREMNDEDTGDREGAPTSVREHGELGPVLTASGESFTGPADVAA